MNKQELTQVLANTLNIYHQDPNKRSIKEDGSCLYNGPKGTHCLVGQLMPQELKNEGSYLLCNERSVAELLYHMEEKGLESDVINKENLGLLSQMQDLHDKPTNFDDSGFTALRDLKVICKDYGLDYEVFEKTLNLKNKTV